MPQDNARRENVTGSSRSMPLSSARLPRRGGRLSVLLLAAAGLAAMPGVASAQSNASKVLDTWGDSLTQFKMPDTTWVNWVRPQFTQRGVNMDGSLRSPSLQGWALAANPFSEPATGMARLGDIHLDTGSYSPTDVDLALPCVGPAWVIGRSYNGTQTYTYTTGINADLSRVKQVLLPGDLKIADYEYVGAGTLVNTELSQPGFYSAIKDGSTYPGWDQFNRIAKNTWKYADRTIYDVDIGHDRNSNITYVQDNVQRTAGGTGGNRAADYIYSIDSLNRVVEALRGEQSGGALVSGKENGGEKWKTSGNALALTQTGNWSTYRQADTGTSYSDETRTHNVVNEINTRVLGGNTYTLAYDANGNLTDDGTDYIYTYDAFNRMMAIKKRTSPFAVVQEFKYNGLGYRTGWHYDADGSGATDGSDAWYYFTSDERWRMVATYRGSESSPKEQFYYHAAGLAGKGGSSYIDSVIMRDRDNTNGFQGASDGTLEERRYVMQNWRADVCVLVSDTSKPTEWVKYSAYGEPYGLPSGDLDADGDADSTDKSSANTLDLVDAYDVRADLDFDGDVDSADVTLIDAKLGEAAGKGKLGTLAAGNRKGYAAYENAAGSIDQLSHVRHRVLNSELGRWVQRDLVLLASRASAYKYDGESYSTTRNNAFEKIVAFASDQVGATGSIVDLFLTTTWCFAQAESAFSKCSQGRIDNTRQKCQDCCTDAATQLLKCVDDALVPAMERCDHAFPGEDGRARREQCLEKYERLREKTINITREIRNTCLAKCRGLPVHPPSPDEVAHVN